MEGLCNNPGRQDLPCGILTGRTIRLLSKISFWQEKMMALSYQKSRISYLDSYMDSM